MMMAWWRATCYTNPNTCINSQKPEITYIQIQIHALVVIKQNPKSIAQVAMIQNQNNLHRMDATTITHKCNVHTHNHNAKPQQTHINTSRRK